MAMEPTADTPVRNLPASTHLRMEVHDHMLLWVRTAWLDLRCVVAESRRWLQAWTTHGRQRRLGSKGAHPLCKELP